MPATQETASSDKPALIFSPKNSMYCPFIIYESPLSFVFYFMTAAVHQIHFYSMDQMCSTRTYSDIVIAEKKEERNHVLYQNL